jgi:sigma-54 dependent transcriptional regulator, acetoin dehydrogenase operon transcriptional activator AcoR
VRGRRYDAMVKRATVTAVSDASRGGEGGKQWALAVALECARPAAPPVRRGLADIAAVEIGRGDERALRRAGGELRIDIPDPMASQRHARLVRAGEGWRVRDAGSKNGIRVNGRRVDEAACGDGDVLECGGTFFVVRHADGPIDDLDAPAGCTALLRTLSPAFERELAILPRIARSRVPVVARGESGTGKELIAAAIHELSGRTGPLVAVNCGAIPPALLESELFGSRRGAFSGAEDRLGLVRGAEGGTLFLDEIAELPAASQTALLRFLQDGEVLPLGAGKRVVVDVRVVAATNSPIEALVAAGGFRHDLYARLRGYELRLLPLRARLEDLGFLCASLLARLERSGAERRLSRAAARALFAHPWPMQVRELEQALRSALATAQGAEIQPADLRLAGQPASERPARGESRRSLDGHAPLAVEPPAPEGDDERARILAALDACAGNQTRAARALKISRTTLVQKLRLHRIPRPRSR